MQTADLYQQYKSQAIQTLTNGEVIVKLFEEASKQISMAIFLLNQDKSSQSFNCIAKAQRIVTTLSNSLNMNYAISLELSDMYRFLFDKLGEANANRDAGLMKELLGIVDELKVTFRQADRIARARNPK